MAVMSFRKTELIDIFEGVLNKTLGEVDTQKVFNRTINNPKITGIAGDVIEQSVLGMPGDNKQQPDIKVDGVDTELKSTGIRVAKKLPKIYEAKEPMSITAVSLQKIVREDFCGSSFWHKLEHMLLVFYHYDSYVTVPAAHYANFKIVGYRFNEFSEVDRERLKADWEIVRDFIIHLQTEYEIPENEYYRISSELRSKLLYIDTAPKYPNPPRFRLKRHFVSNIVQSHFGTSLEQLPVSMNTLNDLDAELKTLSNKYLGWTIRDFINHFNIGYETVDKSIAERIIVKMFGGNAKKLNQIEFFNKADISAKTITLTKAGGRTEDMKLIPVDFDEVSDTNKTFEDSVLYEYFMTKQMICIIFEEESSKSNLDTNIFKGFKRLSFDDDFIEGNVKYTWEEVRRLIVENKLVESYKYNKKGEIIINPNGMRKTSLNFPKSKDCIVFVRGTGSSSDKKTHMINGISMYHQDYWIKGKFIVEQLNSFPFI